VRFLLDHDVPEDLIYLLQELGHHVVRLRDVLAGGLRFDNPAIRS
jgi:hypothetical protein